MASLFDTLQANAFRAGVQARTKQSRDQFKKEVQGLSVSRQKVLGDSALDRTTTNLRGSMYMYFYDPKHKETLPYYDRFPLTIMVDAAPGGFYGLNLHYLPVPLRAKMLDSLMDITNNRKYDETTKFQATYNTLKRASKLKYFKPCFKHYLNSNVRSRFAYVPPPEWEIATFLPTADFQKSGKSTVYKDSRAAI